MINSLFTKLKELRLRSQLRKHYGPDEAFLRSSREQFLNSIEPRGGLARTSINNHAAYWRYALITLLILISTTVGLTTFADQANVPANHPLYQLKRLSEQIRLDLSTPQKQIVLHQEFADRRLKEIKEVKAGVAKNTSLENKLTKDFQHEAESTIDQAEHQNIKQDKQKALCQHILDSVDDTVKSNHLAHIHDRCRSILDKKN